LYGVVSYVAQQRTRELAVRTALGATRGQVWWLVLRDGVSVICVGLAAGMVAAVWLAQSITGMLHDVQPVDPLSLVLVAGLLLLVGLAAVSIPARRAARISAVEALRSE
jgi:ABC-type antimicrobial peptide transport system permease subunit